MATSTRDLSSVLLLGRHLRHWAGLLMCALLLGLFLWIWYDPRIVVGCVRQRIRTRDPQTYLLRIQVPMLPSKLLVVESEQGSNLREASWLLARGDVYRIADADVVFAHDLHSVRLPGWTERIVSMKAAVRWLVAAYSPVDITAGALLLLCGFLFIRLAAAVLGSVVGAFIAWNASAYLALVYSMAVADSALFLVTILGAVAAGALGLRRSGFMAYLLQRFAVILALLLTLPSFGEGLGWPVRWILPLAVMGSLIAPALGICVLASGFLCVGMSISGLFTVVVFVVALLLVHVLSGGRWVVGRRLTLPGRGFRFCRSRPGEVALSDLIA
jgi:hypothetical protein